MTLHQCLAFLEAGRRRKAVERGWSARIARAAQYTPKGFEKFVDLLDGKKPEPDALPPGVEVVDFGAKE